MDDKNRQAPVAVVTGAARGIGAATAIALVESGFHVEASDINEEGLAGTAALAEGKKGSLTTARVDICSTGDVESYAAQCHARHGYIDLLVNNAGFASVAVLEEIDDAHWETVLNLNLMSMMRVSRAFVPAMKEVGRGTIICLGSIAGHSSGWAGRLAYSSAKAGVTGLVRTLAMELAPSGITVNGVAPAGLHATADMVPLGRVGTPEDIGRFIALLASPHAGFMTGQMISVDGGMSVAL